MQSILSLVGENNKMLHRLQRARRLGIFLSALRWVIIIFLAASAYYYLQPIFSQLPEVRAILNSLIQEVKTLSPLNNNPTP